MDPVPFTSRLRRLLWSGMFAGIAALAIAGQSNPAQAQANPYCYAPYYNPYYCQYYSYYYGGGYPAYGYNYPAYPYYSYPYYGPGLAAPFALGFGFGFEGGHFGHREFREGFHRGIAGREFHGGVHPGGVHPGGGPHGHPGGGDHPH